MDFFTSDLHFFHANVIKYSDRPYASVEEMNECLIANINARCSRKDTLYILGDVSFGNKASTLELLKRIHPKMVLVYGNHDKVIRKSQELRDMFDSCHDILERTLRSDGEKFPIVMSHYAMRTWNRRQFGAIQLYGHSHGTLPDDGSRSMDVGVDSNGFMPISLDEILIKLWKREVKCEDNHNER